MGNTLPRCRHVIATGDTAAKQHRKTVHRPFRLGAQRDQFPHIGFVIVDQFLKPEIGAIERLVVGRQNQHILRQHTFQHVTGIEPVLQWIGVRLGRVHRDVGRNARQNLVAGNQDVFFRAIKTSMLWRVTAADNHFPVSSADRDGFAIHNAAEGIRHTIDAMPEAAETGPVFLDQIFGIARRAIEPYTFGRRLMPGIGHQVAAHQVIGARHPQRDIEAPHQPAGQPDMVGMHVGDDHPFDRAALHRAVEQLLPGIARRLVPDASVHHGPAVFIVQQPEIDMIELHRQPHPDPVNAGGHIDNLAQFRPRFEGVVKITPRAHRGLSVTQVPRLSSNIIQSDYGKPLQAASSRRFPPRPPWVATVLGFACRYSPVASCRRKRRNLSIKTIRRRVGDEARNRALAGAGCGNACGRGGVEG